MSYNQYNYKNVEAVHPLGTPGRYTSVKLSQEVALAALGVDALSGDAVICRYRVQSKDGWPRVVATVSLGGRIISLLDFNDWAVYPSDQSIGLRP